MINRSLEEHGEIIKLHPSAQDLEDEKYDFDYSVYVITRETPEQLKSYAMSVSEVKEVVADYIKLDDDEIQRYLEAIKQDETTVSATKASGDSGDLKGKSNPTKKQPTKAVANRSVRVDIEKLDVLMNLVSALIIAKNSLVSSSSSLHEVLDVSYFDQIEYLERVTTNLHESVMKVRWCLLRV